MVKKHIKIVKCSKSAQIVENGVILGPKGHHKAKLGLGTNKKIISKYSIYHADQPPPGFIWVKNTLK